MNFDWYQIFNLDDFEDTGLVSRTFSVDLEGRGDTEVTVYRGVGYSVRWDDHYLPIEFQDHNPYVLDGAAVYVDDDANVFIGFEVEE